MVDMLVQSSGLHVQGPCWSRSAVEVSEVSEMARVLEGVGRCNGSISFLDFFLCFPLSLACFVSSLGPKSLFHPPHDLCSMYVRVSAI
jgi:hypothetical protein